MSPRSVFEKLARSTGLKRSCFRKLDSGAYPRLSWLSFTMSEDHAFTAEALEHFAFAYLLKKSSGLELVKAIRKVLKGGTHVNLVPQP